jgi:hypothetical protein
MWLTDRLVPDHKTIADFRKGASASKTFATWLRRTFTFFQPAKGSLITTQTKKMDWSWAGFRLSALARMASRRRLAVLEMRTNSSLLTASPRTIAPCSCSAQSVSPAAWRIRSRSTSVTLPPASVS